MSRHPRFISAKAKSRPCPRSLAAIEAVQLFLLVRQKLVEDVALLVIGFVLEPLGESGDVLLDIRTRHGRRVFPSYAGQNLPRGAAAGIRAATHA